MNRVGRIVILGLVVVALLAMAAPALATAESEPEEVTTTTVEDPFADGDAPAVVIPPPEEAEDDQPWTSRFIYPTIVIGTILLIIGLIIGYNHSIRNRYKVVAD